MRQRISILTILAVFFLFGLVFAVFHVRNAYQRTAESELLLADVAEIKRIAIGNQGQEKQRTVDTGEVAEHLTRIEQNFMQLSELLLKREQSRKQNGELYTILISVEKSGADDFKRNIIRSLPRTTLRRGASSRAAVRDTPQKQLARSLEAKAAALYGDGENNE